MLKALKHILQLVQNASDIQEALNAMTKAVRTTLDTQACSIYLADRERQEYVLMATEGLNPEAVGCARVPFGEGLLGVVTERAETLNLQDAAKHPNFFKLPFIKEEIYKAFLATPIISRKKILGIIVVQQSHARRYDESEEAELATLAAQLASFIERAEVTGQLRVLWGSTEPAEDILLTGIPAVAGAAVGRAVVVYPLADLEAVPFMETDNIEQEIIEFDAAIQTTRDEIIFMSKRLSPRLPREEQELFEAYSRMLDPESLGDEVIAEIRLGQWAPGALKKVVKRYVARFEEMDNEYMRERAADILDLGRRVLANLQKAEQVDVEYPSDTILVGEQISAANLASVPQGCLVGIVCGTGSKSSHIAILAKALNIPTVMGVASLLPGQLDDQELIVDGYYGQVYVAPSLVLAQEYHRLIEEEASLDKELEGLIGLPAQTLDGHRMKLLVNTGLSADMGMYLSSGAEGVGLYRSEIPFLTRDRFPSSEEQRVTYRQLLSAFAPKPVVMRVLDIGGDKPLSYFPVEEANPFLGWRGIRILLDHPDIFLSQIRAMLRASYQLNNLQILLPMISDLSELSESRRLIKRAYEEVLEEGLEIPFPKLGAMIEVPSAVYQAKAIAAEVDFLSVGSNDLTQYLLAVDRNNARVSGLYDWLHPAVLSALKQVAEAAHAVHKPVSVCGEMAADPMAVVLLLGMGYDALSLHAKSLPRMKWLIRQLEFKAAKKAVIAVCKLNNIAAIRQYMEALLEEKGLGALIRAGR